MRPGADPGAAAEPAPAASPVAAAAVSAPEPATVVDRTLAIGHPVDRMVAVADRIYVSDVMTGAIAVLDAGTGAVALELAVSPDGATVYVLSSATDELIALDAANLVRRSAVPVAASAVDMAISPDGTRIYVSVAEFSDGVAATTAVVDTASLTVVGELPGGPGPAGVVVSSDGRRVFLSESRRQSIDGEFELGVWVLDTTTGERVAVISPPTVPDRLALDLGGRWLYVAEPLDDNLLVIDTTTLRVVAELELSGPLDIVPTSDGTGVLVLGSFPSAVTVLRAP